MSGLVRAAVGAVEAFTGFSVPTSSLVVLMAAVSVVAAVSLAVVGGAEALAAYRSRSAAKAREREAQAARRKGGCAVRCG